MRGIHRNQTPHLDRPRTSRPVEMRLGCTSDVTQRPRQGKRHRASLRTERTTDGADPAIRIEPFP
jgi:hypothetical protein